VGRFVSQRWAPDPTAFGPRRARVGGAFRAFVPHPLATLVLPIDAQVAADLSDAEREVLALDEAPRVAPGPHRLEVLSRLLLRAEAVGSSQIEGLVVSARRLALADLDPALDPSGRALEVVGNIRALTDALAVALAPGPFTVEHLRALHARLLDGTRDAHLGGVVRVQQNWVGGATPRDAVFMPPPADEVPGLLDDLCAYVSGDDHPPLVQAAVAHAQFATLHPFADGNGRTGRALLQLVLRRRGLCRRVVPPISLVLATMSTRYVEGLMGTRRAGAPGSPALIAGWTAWLEFMAQVTRRACGEAERYEQRTDALLERWRERVRAEVGALRADAATWALLEQLPGAPLVTANTAVALTGRSPRAVDSALAKLVAAGVLKQVGGRVRYRLYEAVGVFDLVTEAERSLASPSGDTRQDGPVRPVPARPVKR
jgi:Fic family protein